MSEKSFLFVPGNRSERFAQARGAGADAVPLDLEGAVAPARKEDARVRPSVAAARGPRVNARELASVAGVQRLAFASVEFQVHLPIQGDGQELLFARSQPALASRVAGVLAPVDGVTVAIDDDAVLQAHVARARRLGFGGKLCIHPRQVAAIQAGFRPPPADLEWAQSVVAAVETAGQDAVRLDGKLVDKPIIDRARALLQEARAA